MAHSVNNVITRTYSGKFGNTCMHHDGILRSRPDMSKRILSEKQKEHLARFERAKEFARQVVADAGRSAFYARNLKQWRRKKKNVGIYQLAIRDFMHPPRILAVELDRHDKNNRRAVIIYACDEFQVAGVKVSIITPACEILETGEAVLAENHVYYQYVVSDPAAMRMGNFCRVSVRDIPGNVTEKDFPVLR